MGALVLSLTAAVVLGGMVWVLFGSRIKMATDKLQNDILNIVVYLIIGFIVIFPIVMYIIG